MVATGVGLRTWLIAGVAAGVAAFAPSQPTGSPTADAAFLAVGTAVIVLVGAVAPWWAVAVAAGTALAIAADPVLIVLAAVALAGALWVGATRRDHPEVLAASIGLTLNVFARAELDAGFGTTALVSGAAIALLLLAGFVRQTPSVRKVTLIGAGALVVVGGVATMGFAAAGAQSRHDLAAGRELGRTGRDGCSRAATSRRPRRRSGRPRSSSPTPTTG